ncbi:phosphotransferase [Paenibacillus sp. 19GGS1-52]|uniref:phosphotransferase family protein n=1 Tax=Paenibacillus sp. 19GGS1-52 TaxID=2758563 RepID=UPI001EFA8171|nr:aminoglycoside phosphotransferase family protein [Paenibacillus sp. 19GGS1-52]ULO07006.1 phosphotransferase [Paenibacillus sp. 19GGS1-52]
MNGKLIGEGRTAEIWEHKDQTIVKLYREDVLEEHILREYATSQFVHAQGISTPQPLEIVTIEERKGIVFQQIHGPTLLKVMSEKPWRTREYAQKLAELHYSLHKLEAAQDIGQQKEMLRSCIIKAPMLTGAEKSTILTHLEKLPQGQHLCHGDFHPDNVLMDGQTWIIDWMTGMAGEPAGDAARSVVMFSMGAMPPRASLMTKLMIGIVRKRLTKGYIREYIRLSGHSNVEIDRWILPVAAARLVEWLPLQEKEQLVKEIRKRLQSLPAS